MHEREAVRKWGWAPPALAAGVREGSSVPLGVHSPTRKVGLTSTRVVLGGNSDTHGSEAVVGAGEG